MRSLLDGGGVLERDIAQQCVLGRDKLIRAYYTVLKNWIGEKFFLEPNSCYARANCAANRAEIVRRLKIFENEDDSQHEDDSHPFLGPWAADFDFQLCELCLASMKLAYKSACERLWSQLPGFFGLQPWDELKDFDM